MLQLKENTIYMIIKVECVSPLVQWPEAMETKASPWMFRLMKNLEVDQKLWGVRPSLYAA